MFVSESDSYITIATNCPLSSPQMNLQPAISIATLILYKNTIYEALFQVYINKNKIYAKKTWLRKMKELESSFSTLISLIFSSHDFESYSKSIGMSYSARRQSCKLTRASTVLDFKELWFGKIVFSPRLNVDSKATELTGMVTKSHANSAHSGYLFALFQHN